MPPDCRVSRDTTNIDDDDDYFGVDSFITNDFKFGFVSSKYFEPVPEFKIYKNTRVFSVRIQCVDDNLRLDNDQFDLLRRFNYLLYKDFELKESLNGGFFLIFESNKIKST